MYYSYPQTFGVAANNHCGHCNGLPEHSAYSDWGRFCMACFRWCTYYGPKQEWGDGMSNTPKGEMMLVVSCHDLDKFIEEQTGQNWNTLEVAGDSLTGNGMLEVMEACWEPENWTEAEYPPDHLYYIDTWQGQQDAVEQWLETGEVHEYLRTESVLCYLVREGKLAPGNYAINLWW